MVTLTFSSVESTRERGGQEEERREGGREKGGGGQKRERERELVMKNTQGGKNTLLTSLSPFCFQRRSASLANRAGGKRERAVSLSLFLFFSPLKRKVSCVIKQRGCNVSSVQGRPYCFHREAARDDGVTEGLLPRANRSAEGCYRRRWKGEETGTRGGGGRDGQQR